MSLGQAVADHIDATILLAGLRGTTPDRISTSQVDDFLSTYGYDGRRYSKRSLEPMTRTFYVAGPMSGKKLFNFPQFDAAVEWLHFQGHPYVISPADLDRALWGKQSRTEWEAGRSEDELRRVYYRNNVYYIVQCTDVLLLPGWEKSRGATFEKNLAVELGLAVWELLVTADGEFSHMIPVWPTTATSVYPVASQTILAEADELISGDRQKSYGHALDNFKAIADLWTALLTAKEYCFDAEMKFEVQATDVEEAFRRATGQKQSGWAPQTLEAIATELNKIAGYYSFGPDFLDPEDVGLMLVLLKVAREAANPRRDNRTDIAGYAGCLQQIADRREKEAGK